LSNPDVSLAYVRNLRLAATAAAHSEAPAPVNQNWLRALMIITIAAVIPLRANVPDNFSPSALFSAGRFTVDQGRAAFDNVMDAVKAKLAFHKPSAYELEQQMTASQLIGRWSGYISEASKKFHVPAAWISAVMRQESGGRTMLAENQKITSRVGAVGLMQLMPATYEEMRKEHDLGKNAFDPRDNIMAGAAYLRWLHGKYGFPAMFAAYNAGPGTLQDHLDRGVSLPTETINYIASITRHLDFGSSDRQLKHGKVRLTRPNGRPVTIDPANVRFIMAAQPGEYPRSVHAVISTGRTRQAVREDVAKASAMLGLSDKVSG
jgi:soluble lytic murein transglycosylase-like protein